MTKCESWPRNVENMTVRGVLLVEIYDGRKHCEC